MFAIGASEATISRSADRRLFDRLYLGTSPLRSTAALAA